MSLEHRSRNQAMTNSSYNTAPAANKTSGFKNKDSTETAYENDGSMAQQLAIKIIMKKKQEAGIARDLSEDELRKQVMGEMKSELYQKMDRMIESLKQYRNNFKGQRVPTFLMSKEQLEKHRQTLLKHRDKKSNEKFPDIQNHNRSASCAMNDDNLVDISQNSLHKQGNFDND